MSVQVEFYGIVRQRAGTDRTTVEVGSPEVRLRDVLGEIAERYPPLRGDCIDGHGLARGYTANVNGVQFVSDPETVLNDGDELLILSTDAGG